MGILAVQPDGTAVPLASDVNRYSSVNAAADLVVTTLEEARSSLWLVDSSGRTVREVGREVSSAMDSLVWAGGDRLLYNANLPGGSGIWSSDLAGVSQLIVRGASFPATDAGGRVLVFNRRASGPSGDNVGASATVLELWRAWRRARPVVPWVPRTNWDC